MKFKVFSAALLGVSFLFLGVLTGAIPLWGADTAQAAAQPAEQSPPAAPSSAPAETEPPPGEEDVDTMAAPTASPLPAETPAPEAAPEPESYQPEGAAIVATTITWSDPVKNETGYAVDGRSLLTQPPAAALPAEGYQILIIHTHATEAYTPEGDDVYEAQGDHRTTDKAHSVVQVGQALADALEGCGLRVLHDTELYDWPSYNGSYGRSEQAIRGYLEAHPEIGMVIDLHRDALGDEERVYKTLSDETEPAAAQLMFVVGTDENLEHSGWRDNLALAMSLQGLTEAKYPHLTRPTLLSCYRYNQQLTPGSLLLEVGTAGNTLREAIAAVELFADAVGPSLAALAKGG